MFTVFATASNADTNSAVSEASYDWYIVRKKGGERPVIEPNMKFVDNYSAYYMGKNPDDKVLYLTFDAGYENGNIAKILDVLKANEAQGAFFVLENLIKSCPDLIMRMVNEGHIVANHTMKHKDMTKFTDCDKFTAELCGLEVMYKELTGKEMDKFYRPPKGRFSEQNLLYAQNMGYSTVLWSFAYDDWDNNKQPDRQVAITKVLSNTHNGAIVLLHPTSATNAEILGTLIKEWKEQGYRFGSLYELTGNYTQNENNQNGEINERVIS
jgi:peptidoglycan-N-acetylmuramic acid deacetylase